MAFNPVVWFEIYVDDMERARAFYETVLAVTLAMSLVLGAFDFAFENLFIGILRATPDLVAVAVAISIVVGIIIVVVFAGRERR